jgi:prepilin-type N-terminal cleavage/methylation domain-containing protein
MESPHNKTVERAPDLGFSLVELLIVLVILGILAAVVVLAVRGIVNDGDSAACKSEQQVVGRAVESWFAKNPGTLVPATGVGPDRYEQTLVEAGMIRTTSTILDLSDDGRLIPAAGSPC